MPRTCSGMEKLRKISTFSFYLSSSCVILKESTVLCCGDKHFLGVYRVADLLCFDPREKNLNEVLRKKLE